jgi:hypothetical protein
MPRSHDRVVESTPGDRERRLTCLYSGPRRFLCSDSPKRGAFLLPMICVGG